MSVLPNIARWRLSADQVLEMVARGILGHDDPVELIEGELVEVPPQGPVHRSLSAWIHQELHRAYGSGYHLQSHSTMLAEANSLPEPDVAVVRGHPADYRDRLPTGSDVALVVEISVSSQAFDQAKAAVYGRAGVAEYWQLDVGRRALRCHRSPAPDGEYREITLLAEQDSIALPELQVTWKVADLFL